MNEYDEELLNESNSTYASGFMEAINHVENCATLYLENELKIFGEGDSLTEKLISEIAEKVVAGTIDNLMIEYRKMVTELVGGQE